LVGRGLDVRQDEQRAKQVGGAGGVSTELGEDPPVLRAGRATFDGDASGGRDPIGLLLGGCEPAARVVLKPVMTTGSSRSSIVSGPEAGMG
jgi:hypothetical protein